MGLMRLLAGYLPCNISLPGPKNQIDCMPIMSFTGVNATLAKKIKKKLAIGCIIYGNL